LAISGSGTGLKIDEDIDSKYADTDALRRRLANESRAPSKMRMLLRAVVLLIVVMSAISAIRGLLHMLQAAKREGGRPTGTGRLVKDPVCGTYVAQQTAISARNEFFCSEECRSKFLTDTR
jgi:predicted nucleic acid-binding Zn ribbon protein